MIDINNMTAEDWENLTNEQAKELEKQNTELVGSSVGPNGELVPDGFRERRVRPDGWLEQAIANGTVRDPNVPNPEKNYLGATVVNVPIAVIERKDN